MANTDGGVIVYGIEQDKWAGKELRPFTVSGAGERVTLVAQSRLDEPLQCLRCTPSLLRRTGVQAS